MEICGDPLELPKTSCIETMFESARSHPEKVFYIEADSGKSYTYKELLEGAVKVAKGVQSLGLGKGDVVTLLTDPTFEGMTVNLGIWFSGAASNPVNAAMTTEELSIVLKTTNPKIIYCQKLHPNLEEARKIANTTVPVLRNGAQGNDIDLVGWFSSLPYEDFQLPYIDLEHHVISVLMTSGTTGHPKGIKQRDRTFQIANITIPVISHDFKTLLTSPMFWISNTSITIATISRSSPLVVPRFPVKDDDILDAIDKHKPISWFSGPPTLLRFLENPKSASVDFTCLKSLISGGSAISKEQKLKLNKILLKDKSFVTYLYAATELGAVTTWTQDIDISTDELDSVGKLAKGVQLKIIDEEGTSLGPTKVGEICIKSPCLMAGILLSDGSESAGTDEEGWFHTGDLGYFDEKRLVYIVGRNKDIMKFRGLQIAPAEIESVISLHEGVLECCVVGTPDEQNGELPTAFVVRRTGSQLSEDELTRFVADRVIDAKKLRGGVQFLDSLPRNAVGKLLRRQLLT